MKALYLLLFVDGLALALLTSMFFNIVYYESYFGAMVYLGSLGTLILFMPPTLIIASFMLYQRFKRR